MPSPPSSRFAPHPDEPRRRRGEEPADPTGEPRGDDAESMESVENEELPVSDADLDIDPEGDVEEDAGDAQRFAKSGVKEDMATAAVRPQSPVSPLAGDLRTASGPA